MTHQVLNIMARNSPVRIIRADGSVKKSRSELIREDMTSALRSAVIKRDGGRCRYCAQVPKIIEIDHVIPVIRGGQSVMSNLVTSCRPCNQAKSWRPWKPIPLKDFRNTGIAQKPTPPLRTGPKLRKKDLRMKKRAEQRAERFAATRAERALLYEDNRITDDVRAKMEPKKT